MLAWRQIGCKAIYVVTESLEEAQLFKQLEDSLREEFTGVRSAPRDWAERSWDFICLVIPGVVHSLERALEEGRYQAARDNITVAVYMGAFKVLRRHDTVGWNWQEWRHQRLGGLMNARFAVGYCGTQMNPTPLPTTLALPKRSIDAFMEPSVRLAAWRPVTVMTDVWRPRSTGQPAKWPVLASPLWVETASVYLPGSIERPLFAKELAQLLDVRPDWGDAVIPSAAQWRDGHMVPLRFLVELALPLTRLLTLSPSAPRELRPCRPAIDAEAPVLLNKAVYHGWVWETTDVLKVGVATRSDDSAVDYELWAVGGQAEGMERARHGLRQLMLRWARRRITQEAVAWWKAQQMVDREINRRALVDSLSRWVNGSWFEWTHGSRLLFWRWPQVWQQEAWDGSVAFHKRLPTRRLRFRGIPMEKWQEELEVKKLAKLVDRGYIEHGHVHTVIPRFAVPKGKDDIRLVWDLTLNGVNDTIYTPSFFLPTQDTITRRMHPGTWCGDFDVGEMFHNFRLAESERQYSGVHFSERYQARLRELGVSVAPYMRWGTLMFGWQSSPFKANSMFERALEMAIGNPFNKASPFHFATVRLNLPGSDAYDPGGPRVVKIRIDGLPGVEILVYVDDGRILAITVQLANLAVRQVVSRFQRYGCQDAARKRSPPTQRPRAWTGAWCTRMEEGYGVSCLKTSGTKPKPFSRDYRSV